MNTIDSKQLLQDYTRDGGYPSTIQTADGTFVTGYYSRGVPAHRRYHMGVIRWQPSKSALSIMGTP